MTKFYFKNLLLIVFIILGVNTSYSQQVPNAGFEDWSGAKFDGNIQPASWFASNVSQVGFNFNFAQRESGHSGSYSMMVQDKEVGAMGITETAPGYFSLGKPWAYLEGIDTKSATAGTSGGINFKYRPDSMSVWIKRTGSNTSSEDFHLLYYAWSGTAQSSKYKSKGGDCTSVNQTDEESDIRIETDGNECGTDKAGHQIAEGHWRERKSYGSWTNIRVPIYYFNSDIPSKMNIIFSAGNYPNFRANSGLYAGNSLYVDDVEMIYSSKIQLLYIGGREWKGFNPNSSEEQLYSLGRNAETIPEIMAVRGAGTLTNTRGKTVAFSGRKLSGSEISIKQGEIDGEPTVITVKSEDGKSTSTYKIKFVRQASNNANLAEILINGKPLENYNPDIISYNVTLPYGTNTPAVVEATKAEDRQTIDIIQPTAIEGSAQIKVTAADEKTTKTYIINFEVGQLADNTLKDILINGQSLPGFTPNQTIYRVSLPTTTTAMPVVEAVSAYADGAQTIEYIEPDVIDGGTYQIKVTTPGDPKTKTYKLTFKLEASSYSLLKSLQMGDNLITDFNPEQTTYYVNLPIGTTQLPKITYELGESTQTVTIAEGGLNGVTKVTVVAGNKINTTEYKIVVATKESALSTLKMIYIDGEELPGFSPDKKTYNYSLPIGTTSLPSITVEKGDEYQTVTILEGGLNGTTRITVVAGNGNNSTQYQITFSVKQATNATLKMIYLDGKPLEGFDPNILEYNCPLPQGTTQLPVITYDQADEYQTVTVRSNGLNGDYRITVRSQSGASQTYILHFSVVTSDNADLKMIYLDGKPLSGFNPDTLHYIDTLPIGISVIPKVTYDQADKSQKVFSLLSGQVHILTVTAESGKTKTYTITFVIQRSESAFLKMIYLDGKPLESFDPNTLSYTVALESENCPTITVDKEEGQQITITAPRDAGTAQIHVKPEGGSANIYTIEFISNIVSNTALLDNIYINGSALVEFQPTVFTYDLSYTDTIPAITYDSKPEQTVQLYRNKNIVTLYVSTDTDNTQYAITFHKVLDTDASLKMIYLNGVNLDGFDPKTLSYTVNVPAGQENPSVTFDLQTNKQTSLAGSLDANHYGILVTAANGDTCQYIINFNKQLYSDATLLDLQVEGNAIEFAPEKLEYSLTLAKGEKLPQLYAKSREGQHVASHIVSPTEQNIIVTAENGNSNIYKIFYTFTTDNSAFLTDILLNGQSIAGFHKDTTHYTDTLAWRTMIVPCVQPIGTENQIITTYHSAINGTTHIHVESLDKASKKDYYIHFPVRKSSNTALEYVDMEVPFNFNADSTDYIILLPEGSTAAPILIYGTQEIEQQVRYIARPLGQTSQLIVTAEDGSTRTYNFAFRSTFPQTENILKSLRIKETNEVLDPAIVNHTIKLPYGTTTMTVEYDKSYNEQTVWVEAKGTKQPTRIIVKSNRTGDTDLIYTITPEVSKQNPAVLDGILVDGVAVTNFDKNRFSYIQNRTNATVPQVTIQKANNVEVESTYDQWHWEGTVSSNGYTNTYTIFFHYPNDVIPNGEFDQWTKTTKSNTDKPTYWNAPGDELDVYAGTAKAGNTVSKEGNSTVHLKTTYWAALAGPVPAVINLGEMSSGFAVAGGTRVIPHGFIGFHNTPDNALINYQYANAAGDGALFRFKFFDMNGTAHVVDHRQKNTSSSSEVQIPLNTNNISTFGLDIIIDATGKYPTGSGGADLYIDYIRFAYNSSLNKIMINGETAERNGNDFTYTLKSSSDELPDIQFIGEVTDQAQKITWGEEQLVDYDSRAARTAVITNYAEDGTSTEYTLTIKRPLDSNCFLKDILINNQSLNDFNSENTAYEITIPSSQKTQLDIQPILSGKHQQVTITYKDSVYKIKVEPEKNGINKTYTIKVKTALSSDTELAAISAEGITFDPAVKNYTITANQLPTISFTKKMDGQTVDLNNGILTVTAENGDTASYTIRLNKPEVESIGELTKIEIDGLELQGFNSTTYEYTIDKCPKAISFTRATISDSVIVEQTPTYALLIVIGKEKSQEYRIKYATSILSDDTDLHAIIVNGQPLDGFDKETKQYTYFTDSTTHVEVTTYECAQKLTVIKTYSDTCLLYQYIVMAENGNIGDTIQLAIKPNLNNLPYLTDIRLDGQSISNFNPETNSYVITLPTPSAKLQEPTIPNIDYTTFAPRQMVEIEYGKLGEQTNLVVKSEDKQQTNTYQLLIQAEPSHNANLNAIIINGQIIEGFESGRHFYSVQTSESNINIAWGSDDNFQTTTLSSDSTTYYIQVTAQDQTTINTYSIDIYHLPASSDATLASVLLDNQELQDFHPELNPQLEFSSMQQRYNIYLPAGTTTMPQVSAILNTAGQKVQTIVNNYTTEIHVIAPDGATSNTYTFAFHVPMSNNTLLDMIYINEDSLQNFLSTQYNYFIDLPIGDSIMPRILPIAQEPTQVITDSITAPLQHTIYVTAEDGTVGQYQLNFQRTYSDADTLLAIYGDEVLISGFQPDSFYYAYSLPVGTNTFPVLSWMEADKWQNITITKPQDTPLKQTNQIEVIAGSGKKNIYTISFEILQSTIDTLQMVYIGADSLKRFAADTLEYHIDLAPGDTIVPNVMWKEGDTYQTVTLQTMPYIIGQKRIGWKVALDVQAQDGHSRIYTLYFLFNEVLSANTDLDMIYLNGNPMENFDPKNHTYYVAIPFGEERPSVHVELAEPAKQQKQIIIGDTTHITVIAEDTTITETYTIYFSYQLSSYAYLEGIYQDGMLIQGFRPDSFDYVITLSYGTTKMPTFTYKKGIEDQMVEEEFDDKLDIYTFTVMAPNPDANPVEYNVAINIAPNDDCTLKTLLIKGLEIGEFQKKIYPDTILPLKFHPDSTQYQLIYPRGTDSCELVTREDMEPIANDSNATIETFQDGITIRIQVNAQNGDSVSTYIIEQIIKQGSNTRLKEIKINDNPLRDFDPEILEYSYYADAAQPIVEAIPEDTTTLIEYGYYEAGEPYKIFVQAEDGSTEEYTINFMKPTLGSNNPQAHDVLMKHIKGTNQIAFATTRPNVYAAVYNGHGSLLFFEKVEISNQNDIVLITNADGREELVDVYNPLLTFSLPQTNQFYFYVFYENKERKIASGKLLFVK